MNCQKCYWKEKCDESEVCDMCTGYEETSTREDFYGEWNEYIENFYN